MNYFNPVLILREISSNSYYKTLSEDNHQSNSEDILSFFKKVYGAIEDPLYQLGKFSYECSNSYFLIKDGQEDNILGIQIHINDYKTKQPPVYSVNYNLERGWEILLHYGEERKLIYTQVKPQDQGPHFYGFNYNSVSVGNWTGYYIPGMLKQYIDPKGLIVSTLLSVAFEHSTEMLRKDKELDFISTMLERI